MTRDQKQNILDVMAAERGFSEQMAPKKVMRAGRTLYTSRWTNKGPY